ncbi:MAG: hypothetical protein AB8G99_09400 [Planctomycetaceae bacterium]
MKHLKTTQPKKHRRRGSLIMEVTLVAAVSSVLMGLVVVGIHGLLKGHESHRDTIRNSIVQQRVGTLFRRDCRRAVSAEAVDNGLMLRMGKGETVEYSIDANVLVRSWSGEENTGTDRFSSTRNWTCQLLLANDRARLILEQADGGSKRTLPGKTRTIVFESTVGQHSKLAELASSESSAEGDKQ